MAAPPSEIGSTIAASARFLARVQHFSLKAASAVRGEGGSAPNRAQRHDWAVKVMRGNVDFELMSQQIMTNPTLQASQNPNLADDGINDADLENATNALIDDWAAQIGDVQNPAAQSASVQNNGR